MTMPPASTNVPLASSQRGTGPSRVQGNTNTIPLQDLRPLSISTAPNGSGSRNQAATPVPSASQSTTVRKVPVTTTTLAVGALFATVILGVGAWIGQNYSNRYARLSYELSVWGICADHEVSKLCLTIRCGSVPVFDRHR
jgi:hypothetical protein